MKYLLAILLFFCGNSAFAEETVCPENDVYDCFRLAGYYRGGAAPFPIDIEQAGRLVASAAKLLEDKCQANDWRACRELYRVVSKKRGEFSSKKELSEKEEFSEKDRKHALALWITVTRLGCEADVFRACFRHSGADFAIRQEYSDNLELMRAELDLAKKSDLHAKALLLQQYDIFERSCTQGSISGCMDLLVGSLVYPETVPNRLTLDHETNILSSCEQEPQLCEYVLKAYFSFDSFVALFNVTNPEYSLDDVSAAKIASFVEPCANGQGAFCAAIASLMGDTDSVKAWVDKACKGELGIACVMRAEDAYPQFLFLRDVNPPEKQQALIDASNYYERACSLGKVIGCHALTHLSHQ